MGATRESLKIIKVLLFGFTLVSGIFLPQTHSFAKTIALAPSPVLNPEAALSYVDASTSTVFLKILDITNQTVITTRVIEQSFVIPYTSGYNSDMVFEKTSGILHFAINYGALGQPIKYKTVDQAGNVLTTETVPNPSWWGPLTAKSRAKIALWETSTTTFPVILITSCDYSSPGGYACMPGTHRNEVFAKINGVWQAAIISLANIYNAAEISVNAITNTAYISAATPAVPGYPQHPAVLLRWNNVSNPAAWTFTQAGVMNNWATGGGEVRKIFRNGSGNYALAINLIDHQQLVSPPGRGILFHDTQNSNQQIFHASAELGNLIEFFPGQLGLTVDVWVPHPTIINGWTTLATDFVHYVDGVGVLAWLPIEIHPIPTAPYPAVNVRGGVNLVFQQNYSATSSRLHLASWGERFVMNPGLQRLGLFFRVYTITNMNALTNTWDITVPNQAIGYRDLDLVVY